MNGDEQHDISPGNQGNIEVAREYLPAEATKERSRSEVKSSKVIAGAIRGVFDANVEDIENFHHLISQRVKDQSACDFDKTELVVYLSDGTSRRLSSIDDFKAYSQPNAAVPTVVSMGMAIDIQFPGSPETEKQRVDIAIRASDITAETIEMQMAEDRIRFATDKMQIAVMAAQSDLGIISYTIDHTRLSWGLDIENLIQSHVSKILIPTTRTDKFLKFVREPLRLTTTMVVGLFLSFQVIDFLFGLLFLTEGADTNTSLSDIASNWIVNGQIAKYLVISLITSVVLIVLSSAVARSALANLQKPRPSFILLSKKDQQRREKKLRDHTKRWSRLCAVVAANVAAIAATVLLEDRVLSFWNMVVH